MWFSVVSAITLFIFSFSFYSLLEQSLLLKIENRLYNRAVFIKDNLNNINKISKDSSLSSFDITIISDDKIVFKKGNMDYDWLKKHIVKNEPFFTIESEEFIDTFYILNISNGYVVVADRNMDNKAESVEDTLLILLPLLLFILIFLASRLIDKILVPVKKITKIANEITVSDFSKSIKQPKDDDEIRALVDSFNDMIKRLKDGVQKIERFNNDVSHELKTPLTVIKGEVEITLDRLREPSEYIKSMQVIDEEAEQIKNIVDGLLLLTKYSKTNIKNSFEVCNIESILLNVVEKYNKRLKSKNISLHLEKLENISTKANAILIETIFSNLIDNAIKYTTQNKNIYISLYKDDKIHFIIRDEGIGISKDKLAFVTDRFYRVDESRNKKIKGFGLGLSIVKNSVELHGGDLLINSTKGIGSTLHVEI